MRRAAAAALLCVVTVWMTPLHVALAAGCDTLEYLNDIHAADVALSAGDAPAALRAVRAAEVIDPEAALFLAPVIADLSAVPAATVDARARLDAIDRTLALPSGAACTADTGDARDALHRVYASPAFSSLDQNSQPSVLEQLARAIGGVIARAAGTLGLFGGIVVLVLLVAAVTLFTAWRMRAGGIARLRGAAHDDETLTESASADEEWRAALSAAARDDHRQAIRRGFRSALLEMAHRGRMQVDPAWTTRELLAAASADADLVALLAPAASLFDRTWYSRARVGQAEWDVMRARCEAIRRLAQRRRREQPV